MNIAITQGRLIDPANGIDADQDLFIRDGRVIAVGAAPEGFVADRTIKAAGQIVCPGLIDLSAHLREPGEEHKATIASETRAAAAAGITTLVCQPTTNPVIDTPAVAELVQHHAAQGGYARVLPLGAITQELRGEQLSEMAALKEAGCVAVGNANRPFISTLVQRRAMEYAASFELPVFIYPEDETLRNGGCIHEGGISTRLGLPGYPEAAETVAVARDIALVQQTGVRVHFCRLSSAESVRMVARAQQDNLPVSADCAAHQLHLTEIDVGEFNAQGHVIPPLRTQRDRDGLRRGIAEGPIGAICSDHQPHELDAKLGPFPETEPGISALGTLLPLTLTLVRDGVMELPVALARLTSGPARILGRNLGHLTPGAVADVCIFDPKREWDLTAESLISEGHNTPFLNYAQVGRVTHTLLAGKIVFQLDRTDGNR